ncbi:hypothetical protein B0H14DRAFT_3896042 [Mycena olivaceomarginata]|nr:hypothetical protein B0H14DRAFT_3896042 [Mycena olivaceomarginata]
MSLFRCVLFFPSFPPPPPPPCSIVKPHPYPMSLSSTRAISLLSAFRSAFPACPNDVPTDSTSTVRTVHLGRPDAGVHPSFSPSPPSTLPRYIQSAQDIDRPPLSRLGQQHEAVVGGGPGVLPCGAIPNTGLNIRKAACVPLHEASVWRRAGCEMSGRCEDRRSTHDVYFLLRAGIPFRLRSPLPLPYARSFARAMSSTFCSTLPARHNDAPPDSTSTPYGCISNLTDEQMGCCCSLR